MSNFSITFFAVAQMLAFAAPAYLLMRFKKFDEKSIKDVVTLLLFVSQPCLTAYSFQKATVLIKDGTVTLSQMLLRGGIVFVLAFVLQASFLALAYFVLRKRQEEAEFRIFAIASCFGNSGFYGKCSAVRRSLSRPGEETSKWYAPSTGSISSTMRSITRYASAP